MEIAKSHYLKSYYIFRLKGVQIIRHYMGEKRFIRVTRDDAIQLLRGSVPWLDKLSSQTISNFKLVGMASLNSDMASLNSDMARLNSDMACKF